MAKSFAMLAGAVTGFTAIGVLRSFTRTATAEAKYGKTAAGVPDASNFVQGPKTISGTLEISGTLPDSAAQITVDAVNYKTTSVAENYSGDGEVATVDIEASQSF